MLLELIFKSLAIFLIIQLRKSYAYINVPCQEQALHFPVFPYRHCNILDDPGLLLLSPSMLD